MDEIIKMTDCVGTEVNQGDEVIYTESRYSELKKGTIKKINPKSIPLTTGLVKYSYQFYKI